MFDRNRKHEALSTREVVFGVALAFSNVIIICLLDGLRRSSRVKQEISILNQSLDIQTESYKTLEKSYRAQRRSSHEFRHQLQVIYELLENEEYPEAKNYINELQVAHTSRTLVVKTNHPIIDAILNEKYQTAIKNNIDISFKVNDLSGLPIGADAIVIVLSNVLDNALDACLRLPGDRMIECKLIKSNSLLLSVKNSSPPVNIVRGTILSEKEPKHEHGFGLANVQWILQQYNAQYAIDYADYTFHFVADIPLEKNGQNS